MPSDPFFDTIYQLRTSDNLILFNELPLIADADHDSVAEFLENEYFNERLEYPFSPPEFEVGAALAAAKIVYTTAQLLLYRKHEPEEIPAFFSPLTVVPTPAAMISADLCLRYLPALRTKAEELNPEDLMISIVDKILDEWHYSGLLRAEFITDQHLEEPFKDDTFRQLYIDRVISSKNTEAARHPLIKSQVLAALGNNASELWEEATKL